MMFPQAMESECWVPLSSSRRFQLKRFNQVHSLSISDSQGCRNVLNSISEDQCIGAVCQQFPTQAAFPLPLLATAYSTRYYFAKRNNLISGCFPDICTQYLEWNALARLYMQFSTAICLRLLVGRVLGCVSGCAVHPRLVYQSK